MRETAIPMTRRPCCEFFLASCAFDGGVYRYRLYENGEVEKLFKIDIPSPMYLALEKERLWVVARAPFEGSDESGFAAFNAVSGACEKELQKTGGTVACHISLCESDVYCANYLSGSVFKAPDVLATHKGRGTDEKRQSSPHVHAVIPSPDGRYLLATDLGLDTVFVYNRDLSLASSARVPDGSGVRHGVFSHDGKYFYCVNEMGGSVSVFGFSEPHLSLLSTLSILPSDYEGVGSGAAIKLSASGDRLYVTERRAERIITLKVEREHLSVLARTDTHGKEPRDFTLLANGRYAIVTDQFSDSASVYTLDEDGIPVLLSRFAIPAPLCAVEAEA